MDSLLLINVRDLPLLTSTEHGVEWESINRIAQAYRMEIDGAPGEIIDCYRNDEDDAPLSPLTGRRSPDNAGQTEVEMPRQLEHQEIVFIDRPACPGCASVDLKTKQSERCTNVSRSVSCQTCDKMFRVVIESPEWHTRKPSGLRSAVVGGLPNAHHIDRTSCLVTAGGCFSRRGCSECFEDTTGDGHQQ